MGIRINPERTLQALLMLACVLHALCGPGLAQAAPAGQSFGSNSNAAASRYDNIAPKEALAMISKPATVTDLLQNIKFALDHDLLLQKDFYSDENLKRFFDTPQIKWARNEPLIKSGMLFAFDNPPLKRIDDLPDRSMYQHSEVDISMVLQDRNGKLNASGKMIGIITAACRCPVEIAENVFGTDMEVTNPYAGDSPAHSRHLSTPTHEYGNKALVYTFNTALAKKARVALLIYSDGTVVQLNAYEEEE